MGKSISLSDKKKNWLNDFDLAARKAKSVFVWRAILWFGGATIIALVVLLGADIFLRLEAGVFRWSASFLFMTSIVCFSLQWLKPAIQFKPAPIDVARWLEKSLPNKASGAVVALELSQIDPQDIRYGSLQFQEMAFEQSCQDSVSIPEEIRNRLTWSALQKAAIGFLAASSLLLALTVWQPWNVQFALRRLAQPWLGVYWPLRDQLRIVNLPKAAGYGSVLQLEVIDLLPPLPEDVCVQVRSLDTDTRILAIPARYEEQRAWVELPPLMSDIQVRALGGSVHSTPWETIKVLQIPGFEKSHFQVVLPEYLQSVAIQSEGAEPITEGDSTAYRISGNRIDVVKGSRVRFSGLLNQPVISAVPVFESESIFSQRQGSKSTGRSTDPKDQSTHSWFSRLDDRGTGLSLMGSDGNAAEITESVEWKWRFQLQDAAVLESSENWRINAVPDECPEVFLELPAINQIALGAPLVVSGVATDDWRLRGVDVIARLDSEDAPIQRWSVPLGENDRETRLRMDLDLISAFAAIGVQVKPADRFQVWLEAIDDLGQSGRSQEVTWTVETPQRQLDLMAERKATLSGQLKELAELQSKGLELTRQAADSLEEYSLQQRHVDSLAAIAQLQQRISRQIHEGQSGLSGQVSDTLELLNQNRLNETQLNTEFQRLQQLLDSTHAHLFYGTWQESIQANATLQESLAQGASALSSSRALGDLKEWQQRSLAALKEMREVIAGGESLNNYRSQLTQIADSQSKLLQETSDLLFDELKKRSEVEQQDLEKISGRQISLGVDLERWFIQVQKFVQSQDAELDSVRQLLEKAVLIVSEQQSVATMKTAGRDIQSRLLTQAMDLQRQVINDLNRVLQQLSRGDASNAINEIQSVTDSQPSREAIDAEAEVAFLIQRLQEILGNQQNLLPEYVEISQRLRTEAEEGLASHSLDFLMQRQLEVRQQVDALSVTSAPVFQWTLKTVSSDLSKAMAATRRQRVDPEALHALGDAVRRLEAMLESLVTPSDTSDGLGNQKSPVNPSASPQDDLSQQSSMALSNLKLIRALQFDLKQQTVALEGLSDTVFRNRRLAEIQQNQDEILEQWEMLVESWGITVD
jgi:hypothetical protein